MNRHFVRNRIGSVADLAVQAPQLYQLATRLASQRRRRRSAIMLRRAGWLGAGLALGAGLTTLLTPSSGAEMRHRLSARAQRVRNYVAPKHNGSGAARAERP
jgi:hypothetical protein